MAAPLAYFFLQIENCAALLGDWNIDSQDGLPGQDVVQPSIEFEHIAPIPMPLDIAADRHVPVELVEWLFSSAPLRVCEGEWKQEAPLHCFAVLDPMRVFGLVEMVDASGLAWERLFRSKDGDQDDTGPLIVRLQRENALVKRLMSGSPALYTNDPPWCMWRSAPAIYVRSRLQLSELVRHFRKFTMVQNQEHQRVFLRFWDANCFEDFLLAQQIEGSKIEALFSGISSIVVYTPHSCLRAMSTTQAGRGPIQVNDVSRQRYRLLRQARLEKRLVAHFLNLPEFKETPHDEMANQVRNACAWAAHFGIRDAADQFTLALGICLHWSHQMSLNWMSQSDKLDTWVDTRRRSYVMSKAGEAVRRSKELAVSDV